MMLAFAGRLRVGLDALYRIGGYVAALFLILILVLVALQMIARWSGEMMTGAPDFTGYSMAAASFLALPYALNNGSHIRVSLLLNALGSYRRIGEIWCMAIGTYLSIFFAYHAIKMTRLSYKFNDISQGQDAWPLWIPQMSMCVGVVLLAICFIDNLATLLFTGRDNIRSNAIEAKVE